jgi:TPR repeat protein
VTAHDDERLAAEAVEQGDFSRAMELLLPLAEHHSPYALLTLGWLYECGAAGVSDLQAARSYYEGAAAQGSAAACGYLGALLLRDGREREARDAYERGAQLGDEDSRTMAARMADNAEERLAADALAREDFEEALRLLLPLAERNSEYAFLCLGSLYASGTASAPDTDRARLYFERAIESGSAAAHSELGRLVMKSGDDVHARALFLAGAELGDVPSMSYLGRLMVEGRGGSRDLNEGTAWLERAAAKGHIFAQRFLLGLEERKARSLKDKLTIKKKIAALAVQGAKDILKRY